MTLELVIDPENGAILSSASREPGPSMVVGRVERRWTTRVDPGGFAIPAECVATFEGEPAPPMDRRGGTVTVTPAEED